MFVILCTFFTDVIICIMSKGFSLVRMELTGLSDSIVYLYTINVVFQVVIVIFYIFCPCSHTSQKRSQAVELVNFLILVHPL